MPKAKVETELSREGGYRKVKVEVGERGATKEAIYSAIYDFSKLQELVMDASADPGSANPLLTLFFGENPDRKESEDSAQSFLLWCVNTTVDRKARADVYESLAQESTMITAGDEKVDIMTFPLARLIRGINGMRAQLDTRMITAEMLADKESDPAAKAKILADARTDAEKAIRFGPWKTAAKKLVSATETDDKGNKLPVRAKENVATGMLEAA